MLNQFSRTELIIGRDGINKLNNAKVVIFGLGGVGSYVLEGLVRAGVGHFILVDDDKVSLTNINRQIIATHKTIGKNKVDVAKERALDINPNADIETIQVFVDDSNIDKIINSDIDYIVDAIDSTKSKIEIIKKAKEYGIDAISSMGTGNKIDPCKLEITDISKTSVCPLARVIRKELKKIGINHLKVVYSKEEPVKVDEILMKKTIAEEGSNKSTIPASVSFVPSVAGLIIAGEVIKDIIKKD